MFTNRLLRVLIAATALVFGPAHAAEGRATFIWIGDRITYDVDAYLKGEVRDSKVTAEGVLQRRATVCDGFAALFQYTLE